MTTEQRRASKNSGMLTISPTYSLSISCLCEISNKDFKQRRAFLSSESVRKTALVNPQEEEPEGEGGGFREGWLMQSVTPSWGTTACLVSWRQLSTLRLTVFSLQLLRCQPASLSLFPYSPSPFCGMRMCIQEESFPGSCHPFP